jgi:hypothetical protein
VIKGTLQVFRADSKATTKKRTFLGGFIVSGNKALYAAGDVVLHRNNE